MPLVEKRYAEALVELSVQQNAIELFKDDFKEILGIFNNQADFKAFLLNPELGVEAKKTILQSILTGKIRIELLNFLMLLLDNGRIKNLPGIYEEFVKLADRKQNVLAMTIISATPLEDAQLNRIKEKYRSLYKVSEVKADFVIDPGVIGGIKIKIGDKVVDGTLKSRLEGLKDLIIKS